MKKYHTYIILNLILICCSAPGLSQRHKPVWYEVAVMGGFGNSVFYNRNMYLDHDIAFDLLNPSNTAGVRFGVSVGMESGISVEVRSSNFSQDYGLTNAGQKGDINYHKSIHFSSFDFGVMFRTSTLRAIYIEVGPMVTTTESYYVINTMDNVTEEYFSKVNFNDLEIPDYKNPLVSFCFGLGVVPFSALDDRLRVNLGLRASYSFTDMLINPEKTPVNDGIYSKNNNFEHTYKSPVKTGLFFGTILAEINYFFGYTQTTKSGKSKFRLFTI